MMIEALLSSIAESGTMIEVNALNANNLTALDIILYLPREKEDEQIEDILRKAGAVTATQIISLSSPSAVGSTTNIPKSILQLKGRPSTRDLRNGSLLFAIFMATTCFITRVYPPGGVRQDDYKIYNNNNGTTNIPATTASHRIGTAILGQRPYLYWPFIYLNAVGFLWPLTIIAIIAMGSPIKNLFLIT